MARARNIKPGFFDNEILGELPALTRLLFIGLWCLADREGRLQDRPKRIKKELLGYDDVTADDVDTMLQQLNDNGFIQRYEIAGEQYIQVTNFLKHQNPHCKEQANKVFFAFNNSGTTVALKTVRKTMNYDLDVEVVEVAGGQVGDVIVYDKQLNGFKLKFEGSAKTVKVKYKVRGGMYA